MCVNSRCHGFAVSQYPGRMTPSEGNENGNNIKSLFAVYHRSSRLRSLYTCTYSVQLLLYALVTALSTRSQLHTTVV